MICTVKAYIKCTSPCILGLFAVRLLEQFLVYLEVRLWIDFLARFEVLQMNRANVAKDVRANFTRMRAAREFAAERRCARVETFVVLEVAAVLEALATAGSEADKLGLGVIDD